MLPVEVITSRSDTMDALMMALIILALLLVVRAIETGGTGWLLAGAAALGLAFDVKLLESVVALPGLFVLAFLGLGGTAWRRVRQLALAGVVYVVVALAWLTATLLTPASERPYAIGSTNGSAWNAAFVFNGTDRLGNKSPEPQFTVFVPGRHYPEATQSQRDRIPIVPPSPTRLLARIGPLSGERLGLEMLVALLLGIPALIWGWKAGNEPDEIRARELEGGDRGDSDPPGSPPPGAAAAEPQVTPRSRSRTQMSADDRLRMRRATAAGLGVWMLSGIVLFSHMARLHPRYVEGFVPVVAAMLGIGASWAAAPRGRAAARGADRHDARDRLLRGAASLRDTRRMVGRAGGRDRRGHVRRARARAGRAERGSHAARTGRCDGDDVPVHICRPARDRRHLDQRPHHGRRLCGRPAERRAAPAQLLPARQQPRRLLRARGGVRDADRLADRPGRQAHTGAHDLRWAGVHDRS